MVDIKLPTKHSTSGGFGSSLEALLPRDKRARQVVFALAAVVGILQVKKANDFIYWLDSSGMLLSQIVR